MLRRKLTDPRPGFPSVLGRGTADAGAIVPPSPPPPPNPAVKNLLLLSRVPSGADSAEQVRRLARQSEILSEMFNSLVKTNQLQRIDPLRGAWKINATGSGGSGLTGTFDTPGTYS